ncbi:MAG: hypothetical protein A3G32_01875 [Deltaproteobacteria bacterium RIFCSPLOWO2_12_FULL_40_28]|nr:MAG: hypothetical protein A3C45_06620 [Deltaproteobacteria bacterium RIFCSPHIGHO2_02_FULL_40_28]OGQ18879.1 MAG: hypothetical protein A3E27_09255 [Deltaproteobacteria bacterium RIFCSPHIGHO2_12_FULL_40_32]OGQ40124.1 MAG: hypothetical protein A3I69_01785 [Deltaproteobacteria bacterium RIFCSPLOWO2_02_FULL_40_36]OGQ53307.1 MAG: hypothetical protein A3G32_01875 [Deltaproteobacteria bacterium RIFCSPLOWO2_12_FULL_40_28]
MKKKIKLPQFKSKKQELKHWSQIDLTEYFSSSDFSSVSFPNLKPTSHAISIRLPSYLLLRLKEQANELHIPYQTLMKQYIAKGLL